MKVFLWARPVRGTNNFPSHITGEGLVTWLPVTAREAGKCKYSCVPKNKGNKKQILVDSQQALPQKPMMYTKDAKTLRHGPRAPAADNLEKKSHLMSIMCNDEVIDDTFTYLSCSWCCAQCFTQGFRVFSLKHVEEEAVVQQKYTETWDFETELV